MESRFFKEFKKQSSSPYYKKSTKREKFFFCLYQDEKGVYIKTVDKSLKPRRYSHERLSGPVMEALLLFNRLKKEERESLNWNNPKGNLYLHEYPEIMDKLKPLENIVDYKGELLVFSLDRHSYRLHLDSRGNHYQTWLTLCNSEINRVISPNYAIIKSKIVETHPVGEEFPSLLSIPSTILPKEIGLYLSVVLTNYSNIEIDFNGYREVEGYPLDLTPSLHIDGIDSSGYLSIIPSYSYKDKITPRFYTDYKPTKYVYLDHGSNEIVISQINSGANPYDRFIRVLYFIEEKYELKDSFYIEKDRIIANPNLCRYLLGEELKTILETFTLFGERELGKRGYKKVTPNMELLLTTSIDYLQGDAFLKFENETIPLFQAVTEYDTKGWIQLKGGDKGLVDPSYIDKIKRVINLGPDGVTVSIFDIGYIQDELDGRLKGSLELDIDRVDHNLPVNESLLRGKLREYQVTGVRWLLNLHRLRVSPCLADDMGLGKTIQAISLLQNVETERAGLPVLIVLPKSLIFNWIKEFNKFSPEYSLYSYYGPNRDIKSISGKDIIFTTYHTLRNDIEELRKIEFFYTILDEIQHIKNHGSKISKAVCLIKSKYRMGISGTPVENSLGDLYSVSRFLNPTLFGSYRNFIDKWSGPMAEEDSELVTNILRRKISPIFLRRVKEDVLKELPPKSEQVVYLDMSREQISLYEKVREDYHNKIRLKIRDEGLDKSKLTIIKAFMELRQIATNPDYVTKGIQESPKREAIIDHLLDTVAGGHKVLIFSNFLWSIDGIKGELDSHSIKYRVITGSVSNREEIIEEFNSDPDIKVLLMTLKTGGVGLNLTSANYVYIMDPWWNISAENQAIDRTHRIGQENPVFCYRFIMRGSIEEKILELQEKKRTLFNSLFNPVDPGEFNLDEERVEYLLGNG